MTLIEQIITDFFLSVSISPVSVLRSNQRAIIINHCMCEAGASHHPGNCTSIQLLYTNPGVNPNEMKIRFHGVNRQRQGGGSIIM